MNCKLICIDMDGTFLTDDKTITERNKKAVRSAWEKGAKIVVCTGRLYSSARFYREIIGVKAPVIASNGSYIMGEEDGQVIYKSILGCKNSNKILKVLKKYKLYPHFNSADTIFTEKLVYSSFFYSKANEKLPEDRKINIEVIKDWNDTFIKNESEILKCIATDDDIDKLDLAKKEMRSLNEFEVVSSKFDNFEVMNKGVSKGRAAEILANYYGINSEQVMCIGDNENDLSMIKYAGIGIAMGNGEKCVKDIAEYITDTNNNDGVAKAIEKFVL